MLHSESSLDDGLQAEEDTVPLLSSSTKDPLQSRYRFQDPKIRALSVVCLSSMFIIMWMAAMLAAFFPAIALNEFHISETLIGVIFAVYPLSTFLISPIAAYCAFKLGRMPTMMMGLSMIITGSIVFGYGHEPVVFCIARSMQGIGAGLLMVASTSLMFANIENLDDALAFQEILSGLGYTIGPPLGALLYDGVGFTNAFLVSAGLIGFGLLNVIVLYFKDISRWKKYDEERVFEDPATSSAVKQANKIDVPYSKLVDIQTVLCALASFVLYAVLGMIDPTLGPHLQALLNLKISMVSLVFIYPSVSYSIFAGSASTVMKYLTRKTTMVVGLFFSTLAMVFIAPLPYMDSINNIGVSWAMIIIGGTCFGIGIGWAYVPLMPLLRDGVERVSLKFAHQYRVEEQRISDFVSALFNASTALGQVFGPFVSGLLMQYLPKRREVTCKDPTESNCWSGIQWTYAVFSVICFITFLLCQFLIPNYEREKRKSQKDSEYSVISEKNLPSE